MFNTFKKWVAYSTAATLMTITFGFTNSETKVKEATTINVTMPVKQNKLDIVTGEAVIASLNKTSSTLKPKKVEAAEPAVLSSYYKVQSAYLNVRKSPSNKSYIKDVLVKDYIVKSKTITRNGWVQLQTGGYVKKKYVKLITDNNRAVELFKVQQSKPKPKPVFAKPVKKLVAKPKMTQLAVAKNKPVKSIPVATPVVAKPTGTPQVGVLQSSNVSASDFDSMLSGTQLAGIGHALVEVEQRYGINAFFTLAVAKLESGNGQSRIARDKNNLFGMNAVDSNPYHAAFTYNSKAHSILDFGERLNRNYIQQGLTTLQSINNKYSSSSAWASKVNTIMVGDASKFQ